MLTAPEVLSTFAAVSLDCTHEDATRIARWVQSAGSIEAAINTAGWEHPFYGRLVAYQGAVEEAADPAKFAARLAFEAACALERADRFRREADGWRAKHERYGNPHAAEMAAARERTAIRFLKEAKEKVTRADAIGVRAIRAEAV